MPESRIYDPSGVVEEFSAGMLMEMDFTLEASYMGKFRENFAGPAGVVPVFWGVYRQKSYDGRAPV
jgi:ubiquinone biosynthesis protein